MSYERPPVKSQLRILTGATALGQGTLPAGPMRPYLGRQLSAIEIIARTQDEWTPGQVECVRAFVVLPLIDAEVRAPHQGAVAVALDRFLTERLPGIQWDAVGDQSALLAKYQLVHWMVPAPADETTGEPMALEVYGTVIRVGAFDMAQATDEEVWTWIGAREAQRVRSGDDPPLEGEITLRIMMATYANVADLGLDVPFYL